MPPCFEIVPRSKSTDSRKSGQAVQACSALGISSQCLHLSSHRGAHSAHPCIATDWLPPTLQVAAIRRLRLYKSAAAELRLETSDNSRVGGRQHTYRLGILLCAADADQEKRTLRALARVRRSHCSAGDDSTQHEKKSGSKRDVDGPLSDIRKTSAMTTSWRLTFEVTKAPPRIAPL